MTDEIKIKTNRFKDGNWISNESKEEIKLSISQSTLSFQVSENGKVEKKELSGNAHWFGDYLLFIEGQEYYIRYADEEKLIFGQQQPSALIGQIIWEREFRRI